MKIVKIDIMENNSPSKRLMALIEYEDGKRKTISFGMRNSRGTFADGSSNEKKNAYIARHSKLNEDWSASGVATAGWMSRFILWEKRSNIEIEKLLRDKTGVENVSVKFRRYKVD